MPEQQKVTPDFSAMKSHQIILACGDDAGMWASAFCQTATKLGMDIDEGWMIGWFANAIEAAWTKRMQRAEPETRPVAPDDCIHGASLTMTCPLCESEASERKHLEQKLSGRVGRPMPESFGEN